MQQADTSGGFRSRLLGLAALNAVVLLSYVAVSYALSASVSPRQAELFSGFAHAHGLGAGVERFASGAAFHDPWSFVRAYCAVSSPLLLTFVVLLWLLYRARASLDAQAPRLVFKSAVVFAALAMFSAPIMVQDFFMSAAWGRMALAGVNPYYVDATPPFLEGLPLAVLDIRMTYGPLWALISAVTMALAGGNAVLGSLLFKLVITGAWCVSLAQLRFLVRDRSPWQQCVALALFGWLPLSFLQSAAEGHNDVVMAMCVLLWVTQLEQSRPLRARSWLAAAVCIKYVAAPLFVLDFVHHMFVAKGRLRAYLVSMLGAGAVVAVSFGAFFRGRGFFNATRHMKDWTFFRPNDVIRAIQLLAGAPVGPLGLVVQLAFPALALVVLVRHLRGQPGATRWLAALAIMCAVLFSAVGHVWPWFLMWTLPWIALSPRVPLARFTLGTALMITFGYLPWRVVPHGSESTRFLVPELLLYGFALAWMSLIPRGWYGDAAREGQGP